MLLAYLGVICILVLLLLFAAFDIYWPIGAAIVGAIAIATLWVGIPVFAWVWSHPMAIVAYFLIGLPWLFFRWTRFVEKAFQQQKDRNPGKSEINIPTWRHHKWDFAPYYTYWPVDIVVYTLNNLLRDIWDFVSRMVSETFDRYARWRFRKLTGGA